MNDTEKLKNRLDEIQKENNEKVQEKEQYKQMADSEEKRLEAERRRKKLKEEEQKIQKNFSNKLGTDIAQSKKIFGFIKRYVLIGIVTGVPGIATAYLWDKWQENKMVKNLYEKNIQFVTSSNNRELAKEYEILRKKFNKAYDVDKIEKLLITSDEIEKLKDDHKSIQKLNEEIKKYRETYTKNLGDYIENKIIEKQKLEENITIKETEEEEELEMRRRVFYEVEGE